MPVIRADLIDQTPVPSKLWLECPVIDKREEKMSHRFRLYSVDFLIWLTTPAAKGSSSM